MKKEVDERYCRLDTYLVEAGVGTKKVAKEAIRTEHVQVNGSIQILPSFLVQPDIDQITLDEKILDNHNKTYLMFHKPAGCVTARSDTLLKTILDFLPKEMGKGLFPVGRLDKDTEGLLLLTNDGKYNSQLMEPGAHIPKKYFFWAFGTLDDEKINELQKGVLLTGEDKPTLSAKLTVVEQGILADYRNTLPDNVVINRKKDTDSQPIVSGYLTICEGRKHQVKRMFSSVACPVFYLKRVQIGKLILDETLTPGQYRPLTPNEITISLTCDSEDLS